MTLPRKSGYQVACSTHGVSFQDAARSLLTKKQSEVDPRSWQYVLEHPAMASLRTKLSTARSAGATSQRRAGSTQGQVQQPARSSGNKRPDTPSLHTQLTLEDARLQQDLAEELTLVIERVSSTSGSPKKKLQLGAHLRRLRDYFERSIDGARRQLLYQLHRDAYWHRVYVGSIADSPNPQGTQLLQLIVELQQQYLRTLREARTMEVGTPGSGQGSSPGSMSSLQKLEEVKKRVTIPRRRRNLKKESKATLRAWMFAHLKHPYPTEEEKVELARLAGITVEQTSNWFINARVREWRPMMARERAAQQRKTSGGTEGGKKTKTKKKAVKSSAKKATKTTTKKGRKKKQTG